MTSLVREIPAAPSAIALMHFSNRLTFETDCSDVVASQRVVKSFHSGGRAGAIGVRAGACARCVKIAARLLRPEEVAGYLRNQRRLFSWSVAQAPLQQLRTRPR
jgi:hypothetical protein